MDHGQDTGFDANATGSVSDDAIERMAQVVAHLAVQLTIAQLQLRALGTVLSEVGAVDDAAVRERLAMLARSEARRYLSQNLGESLEGLVETEQLATQIVDFLAMS